MTALGARFINNKRNLYVHILCSLASISVANFQLFAIFKSCVSCKLAGISNLECPAKSAVKTSIIWQAQYIFLAYRLFFFVPQSIIN